jgi:hypothetical protein
MQEGENTHIAIGARHVVAICGKQNLTACPQVRSATANMQ